MPFPGPVFVPSVAKSSGAAAATAMAAAMKDKGLESCIVAKLKLGSSLKL